MNLLNLIHPVFPDARRILYLYSGDRNKVNGYLKAVAGVFAEQEMCLAHRSFDQVTAVPKNVECVELDLSPPITAGQEQAFHDLVKQQKCDLILIQGDEHPWSYSFFNLIPLLADYGESHTIAYISGTFESIPLNEWLVNWRTPVHLQDANYTVDCPGLMLGGELALLHRLTLKRPPSDAVLEIGRYYGRSTLALGHAVKQSGFGTLVSIDPWLQEDFMETMSRHCVSKHVEVLTETSRSAHERWMQTRPDDTLGLLFIDADHRYEGVYQDIQLWSPHLVSGGFICLHDYSEDQHGCMQAINELVIGSGEYTDFELKARLLVARKK